MTPQEAAELKPGDKVLVEVTIEQMHVEENGEVVFDLAADYEDFKFGDGWARAVDIIRKVNSDE